VLSLTLKVLRGGKGTSSNAKVGSQNTER